MAPTPILEMARAYGLHPRLWLLFSSPEAALLLVSTKNRSLLRSRSGRSHVTLPVPTRLLQTDIHSFLGNKPINVWLSFCCECSRLWLVQRIQWQLNERLIGPSKQKRKTRRKECMSVWSSRVGTGSVTWLRPERLRRRLQESRPLALDLARGSRGRDSWCWPKGARPLGTRMEKYANQSRSDETRRARWSRLIFHSTRKAMLDG